MAINYYVMVACATEGKWKQTVQVDEVDDTWIPDGCEEHTLVDDSFAVEKVEEV